MSSLVGTIQGILSRIGPYFLHSRNIGRFLEAVGITYDSGIESLKRGLYLAQPFKADPSGLPVMSVDRTIRLYPNETDASKRLRLSQWLQLHRARGTHIGELRHAQPYFLPDTPIMRIVHQDGAGASATWYTIAADGSISISRKTPSNWDYDGQTSHWSRFWVIIYAPASVVTSVKYDDGGVYDHGPPEVYDGGVVTAVARDIMNMFLEWHSAHSRVGAIILATDPSSFNPSATATTDPTGWTSLPVGNWGSSMSGPPSAHKTRLPTAFWIYEGIP